MINTDTKAILDDALGDTNTRQGIATLAAMVAAASQFSASQVFNNNGLDLALAGIGGAVLASAKVLPTNPNDAVDPVAARANAAQERDVFLAAAKAATPLARARAYATITTLLTLTEATRHVLERVMADNGELAMLVACALPGQPSIADVVSGKLSELIAAVEKEAGPPPLTVDAEKLDLGFASVFGNAGGSGAED